MDYFIYFQVPGKLHLDNYTYLKYLTVEELYLLEVLDGWVIRLP